MDLENLVPSYFKNSNKKIDRLIIDIGNGNKEAVSTLYSLTKNSLYGYVLAIVKNKEDADDILQDVYITIIQNANKYESIGKPMQWIIRIAKNLCYMKFRRNKDMVNMDELIDNILISRNSNMEDRIFIESIFQKISDEEREIIILHLIFGFKHREIAKMLDMKLSTVLSKYNRAIKKIQNENSGNEVGEV